MSRPIAYNTPAVAVNGSITNEDKVISYVVDGRGNDYYNGYADRLWVPSADGAAPIVFVTDTYTRGYEGDPLLSVPLFFACAGTSSAAILYTANRLPGSPGNYTNANDALVDLNKTLGYFILESNDPFQGINATDMAMDLDASKMLSYPQTGVSWFDLSGNGNNGTLTNGPTWDSNGWFVFDGVDDFVQITNAVSLRPSNELTIEMVVRAVTTTAGWNLLYGQNPYTGGQLVFLETGGTLIRALHYVNGVEYRCNTNEAISTTVFKHIVFTFKTGDAIRSYFNGTPSTVESLPAGTFTYNTSNPYYLSYFGANIPNIQYNSVKSYTKTLSQSEVKQNYFGSPIVTDGLVFAVDANNIVSYPKSGTTTYALTGSNNGTLINGTGYSNINGGTWTFDGVDDGINIGTLTPTGGATFEAWINITSGNSNYGAIFTNWGSSADAFFIGTFPSSNYIQVYFNGFLIFEVLNLPFNTWILLTVTNNGSNVSAYVNGILTNTASGTLVSATGVTSIGYDVNRTNYPFKGNISNAKIYNRALSAAEIQQNYQAEQYRFETPAGIVTNGLQLYYDFGNLDSYPSTGTTVYDLSGNSNNGTLINSPGWNSTNGGTIIWDGVDDYINTGKTATQLGFYNANYTMEAWVYPTSLSSDRTMFGTDQSDTRQGLHLVFRSGQIYQGHYASDFGAGTVTTNNWFQIVYTYNASTGVCEIFKNNVSQGTGSILSFIGTTNILLARWGNQFNFQGNGSIYKIYNRVLTTAEMTQNYNYFKGRFGL